MTVLGWESGRASAGHQKVSQMDPAGWTKVPAMHPHLRDTVHVTRQFVVRKGPDSALDKDQTVPVSQVHPADEFLHSPPNAHARRTLGRPY